LISYVAHKDPARMLKLAVLDDIAPVESGTVLEYWRGKTDFTPEGKRRDVFRAASLLDANGRVVLLQARMGDNDYSYRAVVV
jgi:hypothetical protein